MVWLTNPPGMTPFVPVLDYTLSGYLENERNAQMNIFSMFKQLRNIGQGPTGIAVFIFMGYIY